MKKTVASTLLLTALALTGCANKVDLFTFEMQVAPNLAPKDECPWLESPCLLVKVNNLGNNYYIDSTNTWNAWRYGVQGFSYESGYLYTLMVEGTRYRGGIGDPAPNTFRLISVESKVASTDMKKPGDP